MSTDECVTALRAALQRIEAIDNDDWMRSLESRKLEELRFHDRDHDRMFKEKVVEDTGAYERFYGNKKYYTCTNDSRAYVHQWIATHAKGKVFLDYACGDGSNAIRAAQVGAALSIGIDTSSVSVANCIQDAEQAGVSANTVFVQADAENTLLPDNSIDVIICSGMLHHLDLSYAFPELRRILAPGGRMLAVEALSYNPAISLYRKPTPDMRTTWEKAHILGLKDLAFARPFFEIRDIRYWHILNILSPHMPGCKDIFNRIDRILCQTLLIRLMAWMFTFELHKAPGAVTRLSLTPGGNVS